MWASQVTELLEAWRKGDRDAPSKLIPLVYQQLHQIAERHLAHERANHTLQPTALVNEAYLRVIKGKDFHFTDRLHFFAVAARVMRRLLLEHARKRQRHKHGGRLERVTLIEEAIADRAAEIDVIALHEALQRLAALDERQGQLVELRYFGGLTFEESALVLWVSEITVKRQWVAAKAWLFHELRSEGKQ